MSRYIGWLVVSQRTGFMLEGANHAAKIFDTQAIARRACKSLSDQLPVPIPYPDLASALLKGSAFCFETGDAYGTFIKNLRNDAANKPFLVYSQDRTYIRWRHSNEKPVAKTDPHASVAADPSAKTVPAPSAPVEASSFNPAILVK